MHLIRLIIVDESELLRVGLKTSLEAGGDIEVVGDFGPTCETVTAMQRLTPDVVLLNVSWPSGDGISVCRELRGAMPSTKVVMLSCDERDEEMVASIMAGASGYVSTGASKAEIVRAVRCAAHGGSHFDRELADRVIGRLRELMEGRSEWDPALLSEREKAILAIAAEGSSNEQIGRRLNVASSTVRNNMTVIRSKLDLHSRAKLMAYAFRHGMVDDLEDGPSMPEVAN